MPSPDRSVWDEQDDNLTSEDNQLKETEEKSGRALPKPR